MDIEISDNTFLCRFDGDLNVLFCMDNEHELAQRINRFLQQRDHGVVVFDLARVRYISSAFLRVCLMHCKEAGNGNFFIRNVSNDIYTVFQLTGFTEIMHVTRTDPAA